MQWPLVPIVLFGLFAAGIVYLVVFRVATQRTSHATVYAAGGALVVVLIMVLAIAQTPRPAGPPPEVVIDPGHEFACGRTLTPKRNLAHGSVDAVLAGPNGFVITPAAPIERGVTVVVRGWAADAAVQHPMAGVCLLVDGKPSAHEVVAYGATRTDVAQAYKQPAVVKTGFEIRLAAAVLAPGAHSFEVVGVDDRGRASPIAPVLRVTVR